MKARPMLLATAWLLLATSGCDTNEYAVPAGAPDNAAPVADAHPFGKEPPAASGAAVDHLEFNAAADTPAFEPGAAEVDGASLRSTGNAGFVLFGPYATVAPGRYRLELEGTVDDPGAAGVRFDVASHGRIFVERTLSGPAARGPLPALEFVLERETPDVEVRVRTSDGARIRVDSYSVARAP